MSDTEWRERVNDGVDDGWRRTDCPGLADAFDAHRVHVCRRLRVVKLKPGNHLRSWHCIVHERARDELPLLVIDHFFIESLSECLDYAALHLPINEHRVDDLAAIVNRDIALEFYLACLTVNLDDTDMCAERKGEILRLEEVCGGKSRLHVGRQVFSQMRGERYVL